MSKQGLAEFIQIYDSSCNLLRTALDLAQNLHFKLEFAKPEYVKISETDVKMAYSLATNKIMEQIHQLADALGFTRGDYIEGADKRRGWGNCNIYVVGEGSINCDIKDVINE